MSKNCPIYGKAIYMDCLECNDKPCKGIKARKIVIGIDQSYKRTGISVGINENLVLIKSIDLSRYNSNTEKRNALKGVLSKLINNINNKYNILYNNIICVIERIRLRSKGFLNIDYIKSIGALNALIVDVMQGFNIPVYSVDTRCWKSQIIGTSKGESNSYGVPDEKWPTVKWLCRKGYRKEILINVSDSRKTKNTFTKSGCKYMFDNDAADSAAICMFGFLGEKDKLLPEK